MRLYKQLILTTLLLLFLGCGNPRQACGPSLRDDLYALIDTVPGTVGIAFISDTDTVTVNNGVKYPMMSVFKLHQALAVANAIERNGGTLDSLIYVHSDELDRNTWSPMLKKYKSGDFNISVGELMKYAVTNSDNNASNLLFKYIVSPDETDRFIRSVAGDTTFQIRYSEAEMKADNTLSYSNYTSPLAAALLIRQVFTEKLTENASQDSIRQYLTEVTTGQDKLGAAAKGSEVVIFAHKTGSGYRNAAGELMAHNDVGYFQFADGRNYSIAVFIRDFRGSEDEASHIIAGISKCVYKHFTDNTIRHN